MLQQPLWSTLSTQKEEKVLSAFLVPSGERHVCVYDTFVRRTSFKTRDCKSLLKWQTARMNLLEKHSPNFCLVHGGTAEKQHRFNYCHHISNVVAQLLKGRVR